MQVFFASLETFIIQRTNLLYGCLNCTVQTGKFQTFRKSTNMFENLFYSSLIYI